MAERTRRVPALSPGRTDDGVRSLAGIGRVWGAIKYFHPYLASRDVDWDAALIDTIPLVQAASTADAYRAAVDHMLSFLGDPCTRTDVERLPGSTAPAATAAGAWADTDPATGRPELALHTTDDGVAVLVATDYSDFYSLGPNTAWEAMLEQSSRAPALVFDLRHGASPGASWRHMFQVFQLTLARLLDRPLLAAGTRHRLHVGLRQQRGRTYGGYYSALVEVEGQVIPPAPDTFGRRPMAFVVNGSSATGWELLAGLQAAGLATVVMEGASAADFGASFHRLALPYGVSVRMRLNELVAPDGATGFRPDVVVPASPRKGWDGSPAVAAAIAAVRRELAERAARREPGEQPAPNPTRPKAPALAHARFEREYPEMEAPSPAYRLLALFRYWNAVHYLFPYKHLLDGDWEDVLERHVPHFAREGDALDYALAVARLVVESRDSHGHIASEALRAYFGTHVPPVYVQSVEGETVVTHLLDTPAAETPPTDGGLCAGDVVLAVDGEPAAERRERLGAFIAASTPQGLRWRTDRALLGGAEGSVCTMGIRCPDGRVRQVSLRRTLLRESPAYNRPHRTGHVFCVLPEGLGYVDLERLSLAQVDEALAAVWDTPGLILDLRGRAHNTAMAIAPRLAAQDVVVTRLFTPMVDSPDATRWAARPSTQVVRPSPQGQYRGRVAVLINHEAVSHAEHSCLYLEAAPDVTFVGSPTVGADGGTTNVVLPGAVAVWFTGMEVLHGDGRQLQRLGVQPHVHVEPAIADIRAGRDEVLAAAIALLRERQERQERQERHE